MEMPQINRAKLMTPLKALKFALPDDTLVGLEGLSKFTSRARLWKLNPDGSLTNKKDGTLVRPDFEQGRFVNDKGEKVGVGFRTFTGFDNYIRILTDPRIRGPFFKIFLWTFAFSALSVLLTFSLGMLLSGTARAAGPSFSPDLPDSFHFALRGSRSPIDSHTEEACLTRSLARSTNCFEGFSVSRRNGRPIPGGLAPWFYWLISGWAIPT